VAIAIITMVVVVDMVVITITVVAAADINIVVRVTTPLRVTTHLKRMNLWSIDAKRGSGLVWRGFLGCGHAHHLLQTSKFLS